MPTCTSCRHENSDAAKYCEECGAPLEATSISREQRKTVTVLFCDVVGSTALGESTDPEALRALLARYFERMKAIVESHGASVEKFIGDAVMAVFGVPQAHEDDALRACRAAVEMRDAFPDLGLEARIGLNTGEVVTGSEVVATGDTVNVAARLEQAAPPGGILMGEETLRLVREAVETEPVEPLALKGKADAVAAFSLHAVTGTPTRRHALPMVGRRTELRRLRDAYGQAVHDRSCQLFTVLGSAGVGKSRLAHEFFEELDGPVVRGRCLAYGEGITYWPVVEVLRQLDSLPSDPAAAAAIRSLLGDSDQGTSSDEIAWGFRKLLEERAEKAALVCLFDDIHWAEETFLDLVEHVADLSRDAPLLLLCIGRPELLDRRPSWGGGKLNATTVLLEPLSAEETDRLLDQLGGIGAEMAAKIRRVAEGNPLFVEEMLALVRESPNGEVAVPPTIHALLAARLDLLEPSERDVLARGSVEGRVFHRGAVQALSSPETQVPQQLVALVRKELVRPDKAQLPGEDAYRFRHLLIRDATYDALPKATRAELHERLADWLAQHGGDLVELDEILGHHLEQAVRYRTELGWDSSELAEKAGSRLAAAGRRALWRGDDGGAIHLLERSLELVRPLRLDVDLELDLAFAYQWRDPRQATEIAESVARRAAEAGDLRGEALSGAAAVTAQMSYAPDIDELERRARAALEVIELTDYSGQVVVWTALGLVANFRGHSEDWADAGERTLRASRAAGQRYGHLFGLGPALVYGTRPADEALSLLEELAPKISHPGPALQRARLLAMLGRLEEARDVASEAAARLAEMQGDAEETLAVIAEYRGEYEEAVRHQEAVVADLETLDQHSFLSTEAARLARYLCMVDRYDEAETFARRARELGNEQDQATQTLWRQAQALVHAHRGEQDAAERLAREAVELAETTDILDAQGDALRDLGEVLALAGRANEAAGALEEAFARFERKKDLVKAAEAQRRVEELRSEARA